MTTPAITALARAGIDHVVHEYEHDPAITDFGEEAATALGTDAVRVFKTLVVAAGNELLVAMVPVATTLDLKALAAIVGVKRLELADAAAAERSSGSVVGAISPVAQRRALATYLDISALDWDTVYCSAGRRGLEIELAPTDLLAITGGRAVDIARRA